MHVHLTTRRVCACMQTQHHRQINARDEQKVQVFAAGPFTVRCPQRAVPPAYIPQAPPPQAVQMGPQAHYPPPGPPPPGYGGPPPPGYGGPPPPGYPGAPPPGYPAPAQVPPMHK